VCPDGVGSTHVAETCMPAPPAHACAAVQTQSEGRLADQQCGCSTGEPQNFGTVMKTVERQGGTEGAPVKATEK